MSASSQLADAIVYYCKNIDDWKVYDECYARHEPSGVVLWIGTLMNVEAPVEVEFGFWDRRKVERAVKDMLARKAQAAFGGPRPLPDISDKMPGDTVQITARVGDANGRKWVELLDEDGVLRPVSQTLYTGGK